MIQIHTSPQGPSLERVLATLPDSPGVYLMRDAEGAVLYVGKARALVQRVRQYFGGGDGRLQIPALMTHVASIETIVTLSEAEAFILERDLITKYKPRYNIRLKDDKAYLSVRIDENAAWPRLELVRKVNDDGARYFGPYTFSYELRELLDIVRRVVPLRSCSDTVFYNRQRPCLEYQIKRCCGPCCIAVDREEYRNYVKQAVAILSGKTDRLRRELEERMERAATELRFEDAAAYRDRIDVLSSMKDGQRFVSVQGENRDVWGLAREERLAVLSLVCVRGGRVGETSNFTFHDVEITDAEIVEAALSQFYRDDRVVPEEIVVPVESESWPMIAEALSRRVEHAVSLFVPQRGIRSHLLAMATLNAKQQFITRFDAESRYLEIAKDLAVLASLRQVPRRVECIDISNLQGSDIVGALVVFFDGQPEKSRYRKYRISAQGKPDDFASIYEVVKRRLSHAGDEDGLPDLLVIDGGPGQLREAQRARDEAGIQLDIISLAKLRTERDAFSSTLEGVPERLYLDPKGEAIALTEGAELTKFLQRLRDETHRFVITFHRTSRAKRVLRSLLDDVAGVGPERRARLFRHFGSVAVMSTASAEEIARHGRMPKSLAEKILEKIRKSPESEPDAS